MKRKGKKEARGEHVIILYIEMIFFPYYLNFVLNVDNIL